jgi:predicted XRE-type DNA-binding protein
MNTLMPKTQDRALLKVDKMDTESNKESCEVSFETPRYIRCPDCGEQIMMVPVLSQMIEAIENHISTHKLHQDSLKPELGIEHPKEPSIEENLAEQVLQRAAEISDVLGKNQTWVNRQ